MRARSSFLSLTALVLALGCGEELTPPGTTSSDSSEDSDDTEHGSADPSDDVPDHSQSGDPSEGHESDDSGDTSTSNTSTSTDTTPAQACAAALDQGACEKVQPGADAGTCRWIDIVRFDGPGAACDQGTASHRCVLVGKVVEDDCPAGCGEIFPYYYRSASGELELAGGAFGCGEQPADFSRCVFDPSTGVLQMGPEACACACAGGD